MAETALDESRFYCISAELPQCLRADRTTIEPVRQPFLKWSNHATAGDRTIVQTPGELHSADLRRPVEGQCVRAVWSSSDDVTMRPRSFVSDRTRLTMRRRNPVTSVFQFDTCGASVTHVQPEPHYVLWGVSCCTLNGRGRAD